MKRMHRLLPILVVAILVAMSTTAFAAGAPKVTITTTVNVDKTTGYAPGEVVHVTATGKYSTGANVTSIRSMTCTIKNPSGTTIVSAAPMVVTDGVGRYDYTVLTGAVSGTWTVTCTITDTNRIAGTGSKTFSVIGSPHSALVWSGYPSSCRSCHASQFSAMYGALHYQYQSPAPDNTNKPGTMQGKMTNAMNAYCINLLGNWTTCGKCHVGRGALPVLTSNPTTTQLDNIDCLVCHNQAYQLARVRLTDGTMGPPAGTAQATLDGYVQNIAKPTRTNCLKCHAFGGGGDAVKRGDLSSAQYNTTDGNHDVHMATGRGNLSCQRCHKFVNHKVTGKGSDLESTDYASEVKCATSECHPNRVSGGHVTTAVNKHLAHVACQTCHIPKYGKVATEMQRDWRTAATPGQPSHPSSVKQSNVTPTYKWWNRKTWNYLKGDAAVYNAATGAYQMDILQGSVAGDTTNKIYPFKYKISYQPLRTTGNILVALDTNEYLNVSGDYVTSVQKGLFNMGFNSADAYTTVKADTYQLLNHTIPDAQSTGGVLTCANCHEATIGGAGTAMALKTMGYAKKADYSVICTQCHSQKTWKGYAAGHSRHVDSVKADCSYCHTFSRPERGGTMP